MSWAKNSLGGMLVAGIAAIAARMEVLGAVAIDGFSFIGVPPLQMGMRNPGCSPIVVIDFDAFRSQVAMEKSFDFCLFMILLHANKGHVNEWTCCGRHFTNASSCGANRVMLSGQAPRCHELPNNGVGVILLFGLLDDICHCPGPPNLRISVKTATTQLLCLYVR